MNRQEFLTKVGQIVGTDRQAQHGNPEDNFAPMAQMWSTYLTKTNGQPVTISAMDVAWMMVLFKACRAAANPYNEENIIDGAGYLACLAPMLDKFIPGAKVAVPSEPAIALKVPLNTLNNIKKMSPDEVLRALGAVQAY